jgi:predicted TIM-barrel fold metal-dependent hydrolase
MKRREFLAGWVAVAAAQGAPVPIIDSHIHLYDPTRPQGVPWPSKSETALYRPTLPDRYRKLAAPLGVVGAIAVESSPLVEDNQWVLDAAAQDSIMVGAVGNLEPGKPEFGAQLERLHRDPLFLGIRYGNLWNRDIGADLARPEFVAGLKLLAQAELMLDSANPMPSLIEALLRVTERAPGLRVVIDHLPHLDPPAGAEGLAYERNLRELARRPHVFVKLSWVIRQVNGRVVREAAFYKERLDHLFEVFGENRVLFGSDWPNCDHWTTIDVAMSIVREYFAGKPRQAVEKYFWRNSVAAYRWTPRDAAQPRA